jgi:hypothetical protein|nr:MAG TPA: hypothetical protein [Caudoviricetes sp.]
MNFKLPCPWIEKGRECTVYIEKYGVVKAYDAEIVECSIIADDDWQLCMCKLSDGSLHWVHYSALEPIYTVKEIMQYADKTIIEEHWIDVNGDKRALYLKKFCGEYFKVDECWGSRKMKKVKI